MGGAEVTAPERVTYVGHATVLVELGGTRLLTDPVLRGRVGPLRRHGAAPAPGLTQGLDAVLISHLHHDHADLPSLRRIGRDVRVLASPGGGEFLGRHGFADVTELAPGESARVGEVTVTATEAWHPGGGRFERESRAVGFTLSAGHRRVYFAGDTDLFDDMGKLGGELDLALLPIWGWGTSIGEGHLDPERAAQAAALLSPRIAVPIHWGTLYPLGLARLRPGPLSTPPREFVARARDLAPQVEVRVLAPGEATSLA
ncbi:MAG TPA: MBL fold metallo-hydrolase [Solirubrobacterales bacterium]|nr:MBL fold metallo-hydrolase [Solirubrobacterales bacterium]